MPPHLCNLTDTLIIICLNGRHIGNQCIAWESRDLGLTIINYVTFNALDV